MAEATLELLLSRLDESNQGTLDLDSDLEAIIDKISRPQDQTRCSDGASRPGGAVVLRFQLSQLPTKVCASLVKAARWPTRLHQHIA